MTEKRPLLSILILNYDTLDQTGQRSLLVGLSS